MKTLKRISLIFVAILILIIPVSVNCFAVDPVSFTEATTLGATIVDLYGAVNNTSLAYNAIQPNGALTEIVTLYQNYSSSASDPYTLAAIGAAAAAAGAIAVVYDAVTGQGYVQLYQEQYIESMDGYWDYQLSDLGFVRNSVSGLFNWTNSQGIVHPVPIFVNQTTTINGYTVHYLPIEYSSSAYYTSDFNDVFEFSAVRPNGTYGVIYLASFSPNRNYYFVQQGQPYPTASSMNQSETIGNITLYFGYRSGWNPNNTVGYITPDFTNNLDNADINSPLSNLFGANINNLTIENGQESISVGKSNYIGDPLQNSLEITIPNVNDPDYIPQPRRINTDIPWNPDWGNPMPDGVSTPEYNVPYPVTDPSILNDAVPGIWDYIVSNPIEVEDAQVNPDPEPDPGNPTEVYTPFLPVTLPSFNFSFSGIWHYVREWVASLGAWFTMVFEVWSHLPYAIVVPVFASAVIVIVLGVYKRFFM